MILNNEKTIKIWLLQNDLTQADLAKQLDVSPRTITNMLKDVSRLQQLALSGLDTELKTKNH